MKIELERSVEIAASAAAVWAVLADWGDPSGWVPKLVRCEVTRGGVAGPGARRRLVETDQILEEEIVGWEPPRRLVLAVAGVPRVVRDVVDDYTVEPVGTGRCRLRVRSSSRTGLGLLGVLASPIARRVQGRELERLLAAMKRFVETGVPAAALRSVAVEG